MSATGNHQGGTTVVGHSMGGWVASVAATQQGAGLDGVVVIDSPIRDGAPEGGRLRDRGGPRTGYRSRAEILARFTPVPAQSGNLGYISRHIAEQSVRRDGLRWFWKFDPTVFRLPTEAYCVAEPQPLERMFEAMHCRTGYIRCEHGVVPPEMARLLRSVLQLRGPFVELAGAGHHPMLDQPLALVGSLRTLLEVCSIT